MQPKSLYVFMYISSWISKTEKWVKISRKSQRGIKECDMHVVFKGFGPPRYREIEKLFSSLFCSFGITRSKRFEILNDSVTTNTKRMHKKLDKVCIANHPLHFVSNQIQYFSHRHWKLCKNDFCWNLCWKSSRLRIMKSLCKENFYRGSSSSNKFGAFFAESISLRVISSIN